jgi:hypothetical protein
MKTSRRPGWNFIIVALVSALAWLPVAARQQGERGLALKPRPLPVGQYYALLIGNNFYKRVRSLKTAEDDAREVERVLRSDYGFRTKLLLNATRQQIISTLNAYRRELDADSSLLIYYAGHGYNDWLNYLNANPTDFRSMVRGFVDSTEYRRRFGAP